MTDAPTLRSLIAKLEEATEPSRELDARVHVAIVNPMVMTDGGGLDGKRPAVWKLAQKVFNDDWNWEDDVAPLISAPSYTSSLDAAVGLVPEGCRWEVQQDLTAAFASVFASAGWVVTDRCSTPAMALTIAALKARLAMEERDDG